MACHLTTGVSTKDIRPEREWRVYRGMDLLRSQIYTVDSIRMPGMKFSHAFDFEGACAYVCVCVCMCVCACARELFVANLTCKHKTMTCVKP